MKHKNHGECDSIRRLIKEIDEVFDVYYDADIEKYVITQLDDMIFDSIRHDDLSSDFFYNMRRVVYLNKEQKLLEEINKNNAIAERMKEKKIEDMAYNLAKDIRKPLINEY